MIKDPQQKKVPDIVDHLLDALDEYTASCTVVITSVNPHISHGSGVAVKYRDQQFILTAAHVLKEEPDNKNIKILGRPDGPLRMLRGKREFEKAVASGFTPTFSTSVFINIVDRIVNERDDIAALRVRDLDKDLPHTVLHQIPMGNFEIAVGEPLSIFGFPGELAKHYTRRSTQQGGWAAFPHITIEAIQDVSQAPERLDPSQDFVTSLDYDEEKCDPHGMSGCGAWRIPPGNKGELWSADKSELLGIEVGHYQKSKLLRFVHINRVVRLLNTGK